MIFLLFISFIFSIDILTSFNELIFKNLKNNICNYDITYICDKNTTFYNIKNESYIPSYLNDYKIIGNNIGFTNNKIDMLYSTNNNICNTNIKKIIFFLIDISGSMKKNKQDIIDTILYIININKEHYFYIIYFDEIVTIKTGDYTFIKSEILSLSMTNKKTNLEKGINNIFDIINDQHFENDIQILLFTDGKINIGLQNTNLINFISDKINNNTIIYIFTMDIYINLNFIYQLSCSTSSIWINQYNNIYKYNKFLELYTNGQYIFYDNMYLGTIFEGNLNKYLKNNTKLNMIRNYIDKSTVCNNQYININFNYYNKTIKKCIIKFNDKQIKNIYNYDLYIITILLVLLACCGLYFIILIVTLINILLCIISLYIIKIMINIIKKYITKKTTKKWEIHVNERFDYLKSMNE